MSLVKIRDMQPEDEYFVGTCTHVGESDEIDASAKRRLAWLRSMYEKGLRVKVAILGSNQVGFLHVIPIEISPWGPLGRDLLVIPCLVVQTRWKGKGIGHILIDAGEKEAVRQEKKGLVVGGYYHDFWFMPASFFEKCGFSPVKIRQVTIISEGRKEYLNKEALLWKVLHSLAEPPEFLEPNYEFGPRGGKIVVDLFWNTFCQTSNIEAQRVREVVPEFGDSVILNEYCADDQAILSRYQIPRGIFINGKEVGWGYEAPREGIREAISQSVHLHLK